MKNMTTKGLHALALILVLLLAGCLDLDVSNENNPDRDQVLADPVDVEELLASTFFDYWIGNYGYESGSVMMSVMADELSCSWGNAGMKDQGSEPRVAWDNASTYNYSVNTERPWQQNYLVISNVSDALAALEQDPDAFAEAGIDGARMQAFGNLMLGMAHGSLALRFDQGFTVDQNTDLLLIQLQDYNTVAQYAYDKFDLAIAAAADMGDAAEGWIFGVSVDKDYLIALAYSYKARIAANLARTPAERDAADWAAIMSDAQKGIATDLAPVATGPQANWRHDNALLWIGEDAGGTWARADYKTVGPADESGGYDTWLATPVQNRNIFGGFISTDRRVMAADTTDGTDFFYGLSGGNWPSNRGTYHYSTLGHKRYNNYTLTYAGPMSIFSTVELDLLVAEGMLRTGDAAGAATLINQTRVTRGELPAADAGADALGAASDIGSHLNADGLWAMLKYEKHIELFALASGGAYFDDRGWGDLTSGTPVQFPVPGNELEVLQLANYTFGGAGDSAAPKVAIGTKPSPF